jgi:transposase InsO family protein
MQESGLFAQIRGGFKVITTQSDHGYKLYPNRIKNVPAPMAPDKLWVADITYIRLMTEFVYLAVVMDRYSRKVIGWAISRSLKHELCLEALNMAIKKRKPPRGVIHHSDRGVQYACDSYIQVLTENGFEISMSRKGNPYDNAHMESFMKTLKADEVNLYEYETLEDVMERLPVFLETTYNKKRLHSSIGYLTPEEFEAKWRWNNQTMQISPEPCM